MPRYNDIFDITVGAISNRKIMNAISSHRNLELSNPKESQPSYNTMLYVREMFNSFPFFYNSSFRAILRNLEDLSIIDGSHIMNSLSEKSQFCQSFKAAFTEYRKDLLFDSDTKILDLGSGNLDIKNILKELGYINVEYIGSGKTCEWILKNQNCKSEDYRLRDQETLKFLDKFDIIIISRPQYSDDLIFQTIEYLKAHTNKVFVHMNNVNLTSDCSSTGEISIYYDMTLDSHNIFMSVNFKLKDRKNKISRSDPCKTETKKVNPTYIKLLDLMFFRKTKFYDAMIRKSFALCFKGYNFEKVYIHNEILNDLGPIVEDRDCERVLKFKYSKSLMISLLVSHFVHYNFEEDPFRLRYLYDKTLEYKALSKAAKFLIVEGKILDKKIIGFCMKGYISKRDADLMCNLLDEEQRSYVDKLDMLRNFCHYGLYFKKHGGIYESDSDKDFLRRIYEKEYDHIFYDRVYCYIIIRCLVLEVYNEEPHATMDILISLYQNDKYDKKIVMKFISIYRSMYSLKFKLHITSKVEKIFRPLLCNLHATIMKLCNVGCLPVKNSLIHNLVYDDHLEEIEGLIEHSSSAGIGCCSMILSDEDETLWEMQLESDDFDSEKFSYDSREDLTRSYYLFGDHIRTSECENMLFECFNESTESQGGSRVLRSFLNVMTGTFLFSEGENSYLGDMQKEHRRCKKYICRFELMRDEIEDLDHRALVHEFEILGRLMPYFDAHRKIEWIMTALDYFERIQKGSFRLNLMIILCPLEEKKKIFELFENEISDLFGK